MSIIQRIQITFEEKKWIPALINGLLISSVTALFVSIILILPVSVFSDEFAQERQAFESDPNGFIFLRQFAHDNYAIELALQSKYKNYRLFDLRHRGYPAASMDVASGFCALTFHEKNITADTHGLNENLKPLWVKGVMIHEFGHCIDIKRDMPTFADPTVFTHAIWPDDITGITDINTYLQTAEQQSTRLWREVFADIFLVGYWKLTEPMNSNLLIKYLRNKRDADKDHDKAHMTICWIDLAEQAPRPNSVNELLGWTDNLRKSPPCIEDVPK
jgi:hypothetical protein